MRQCAICCIERVSGGIGFGVRGRRSCSVCHHFGFLVKHFEIVHHGLFEMNRGPVDLPLPSRKNVKPRNPTLNINFPLFGHSGRRHNSEFEATFVPLAAHVGCLRQCESQASGFQRPGLTRIARCQGGLV